MGTVNVWLLDLDSVADSAAIDTLDAAERTRAAALVDATERRRYVAAHAELRRLLGDATGVEPAQLVVDRAPCAACGSPHGKPLLANGPNFSLSRSGGHALVAIADEPVGADLEQRASSEAPIADLLAPGETTGDPLRTWVRKEALLKLTGDGLTRSMTTLRGDDPRVVDLEVGGHLVGALALFTDASQRSTKVRVR